MIITGTNKKILYLSPYWCGKTHDYRILKEELKPGLNWFKNKQVRLDLAYIGFDKDYACEQVYLPLKSRKARPLTVAEKESNQALASQRIGIEHSIGGFKRYRVLSDRLRAHDMAAYDSVCEVCAGLWNYYLSN
jgi:hypothetical protein